MPRLTPERIAECKGGIKAFMNEYAKHPDWSKEDSDYQLANDLSDALSDLAEQTERAEKAEMLHVRWLTAATTAGDRITDLRDLLKDIYSLDCEERAIGGGPGFKERKSTVMRRLAEEFEP